MKTTDGDDFSMMVLNSGENDDDNWMMILFW